MRRAFCDAIIACLARFLITCGRRIRKYKTAGACRMGFGVRMAAARAPIKCLQSNGQSDHSQGHSSHLTVTLCHTLPTAPDAPSDNPAPAEPSLFPPDKPAFAQLRPEESTGPALLQPASQARSHRSRPTDREKDRS